jgi:hypothetical protein
MYTPKKNPFDDLMLHIDKLPHDNATCIACSIEKGTKVNKNKLDIMQEAERTQFKEAVGSTVYTPDGLVEGIVTIEIKKWEGHAKVNYSQISLKFNEAKALMVQLEEAIKHLDTQLHIMKEKRNG